MGTAASAITAWRGKSFWSVNTHRALHTLLRTNFRQSSLSPSLTIGSPAFQVGKHASKTQRMKSKKKQPIPCCDMTSDVEPHRFKAFSLPSVYQLPNAKTYCAFVIDTIIWNSRLHFGKLFQICNWISETLNVQRVQ